jgi:uncharacterized protein (TIGR03663 family)
MTTRPRIRSLPSNPINLARIHNPSKTRRWDLAILATILTLAAILRFWDLGARAFHGDEAITAGFSWQLFDGRGYVHNPLTHGPFQFLGTAFVFILFGDSDYTARLLPALFGTALVALPFFLRRYLGRSGTIATALLLAVSPTLLYFSRFAREDIYFAFFTLAMFICVWRYLQETHRRYLYLFAALLALSFATKETAYIVVAMLLVYLDVLAMEDLVPQLLGETRHFDEEPEGGTSLYDLLGVPENASPKTVRRAYKRWAKNGSNSDPRSITMAFHVLSDPAERDAYDRQRERTVRSEDEIFAGTEPSTKDNLRRLAVGAALLVFAPLLLAFWPLIGSLRRRLKLEVFPHAGHLMMLTVCLSLPLFGPATQKLPFVGDFGGGVGEISAMHATVLTLLVIAFVLGVMWRPSVWVVSGAIFWTIFIFFFTTFFTNVNGFWTGTWGSLDYWLNQQQVHLGDQPSYYYFMLLPVYELLPLVFGLGAVLFCAFRSDRLHRILALSALVLVVLLAFAGARLPLIGPFRTEVGFGIVIVVALTLPLDALNRLLLYWTLAALFAYTVAGEKMPWLAVHIALPLSILAGRSIGSVLSGFDPRVGLSSRRRWLPVAGASSSAAAAVGAFAIAGANGMVVAASLCLAIVALLIIIRSALSINMRAGMRLAGVTVAAALLVFAVRGSVLSSWGHPNLLNNASTLASRDRGDTPVELLQYVQSSPDIPIIRNAIDELAADSGEGNHLPIVIDANDDYAWPWAWYLRKYDNLTIQSLNPGYVPPEGSVVLASWQDSSSMTLDPGHFTDGIRYHHRWWFPASYAGFSSQQIILDLFNPGSWRTWSNYILDRKLPEGLPTLDAVIYFPKEMPYSEVLAASLQKK